MSASPTVHAVHPVVWFRARPRVADWALAVVVLVPHLLAALGLADDVDLGPGDRAASVVLVLVGCLALGLRRTRPVAAINLAGSTAVLHAALGLQVEGNTGIPVIIALYSIAAYGTRRLAVTALWSTMFFIAVVAVFFTLHDGEPGVPYADIVGNYVIFVTSWFVGDSVRGRREYVAQLEREALEAEADRARDAARAVDEERARIARELHDVVAHHVSVMVVQAGGARRALDARPEQAAAALAAIEATGREALEELRRVLGVLRTTGSGAAEGLAPQPSLAGLSALAEQVTEAGLPVEVEVQGDARPLPSGVELSAYRIVQEALTNALKHAGRATARVVLRYVRDAVELEVLDDGRGAAATATAVRSGGSGLVGMRERAELFGGELHAGPRAGGGFAVRARLPT